MRPAQNGGARVTRYVVRALKMRPNGEVASRMVRVRSGKRQAVTLRLDNGCYRVEVVAVTEVGRSKAAVSRTVKAR